MKILIVEDEAVAARRIKRLVLELLGDTVESIECIETLQGSEDFLSHNSIDLLLLDLNLNGDDGFHLLSLATSARYQTIIVSANTDRALLAFEYGVLDFVPKPVDRDRLGKALDRYQSTEKNRSTHAKYLAIRNYGSVDMISTDTVRYLKGADDYAEVHCRDNRVYLHAKSLAALEKILPPQFLRVHRSFLVDKNDILKVHVHGGGKYEIELINREKLPLSRSYYKELGETLGGIA